MTRADLMLGDRPWTVRVRTTRRPNRVAWLTLAGGALALAVAASVVGGVFSGLLPAVAAVAWAIAGLGPVVRLEGGGRRPLSSTEYVEWGAHTSLTNAEHEHARKTAEMRGRR